MGEAGLGTPPQEPGAEVLSGRVSSPSPTASCLLPSPSRGNKCLQMHASRVLLVALAGMGEELKDQRGGGHALGGRSGFLRDKNSQGG